MDILSALGVALLTLILLTLFSWLAESRTNTHPTRANEDAARGDASNARRFPSLRLLDSAYGSQVTPRAPESFLKRMCPTLITQVYSFSLPAIRFLGRHAPRSDFIKSLTATARDLRSTLASLNPYAERHQREINELKTALSNAQDALCNSQQFLRTAGQKLVMSRSENNTLSRDLAHARAALCELSRVKRDSEVTSAMLAKKTTELKKIQDAVGSWKGELRTTQAELNVLQSELRAARHELDSANTGLDAARADLDKARVDRDKAREDVSRRRAAYHELRDMNQDVVAAYNASRSQSARMQRKYAALERYTEEVKAMAKNLLEDYGRVNEEKRTMVRDMEGLVKEMRRVEAKLEGSKEEKQVLAKEIKQLQDVAADLRSQARETEEREHEMADALREKEKELLESKSDATKLEALVARLRQAASVVLEENDALAEEMRSMKEEVRALKAEAALSSTPRMSTAMTFAPTPAMVSQTLRKNPTPATISRSLTALSSTVAQHRRSTSTASTATAEPTPRATTVLKINSLNPMVPSATSMSSSTNMLSCSTNLMATSTNSMASSTMSSATLDLTSINKERTMLMDTGDSFYQAALLSSSAGFGASISSNAALVPVEGSRDACLSIITDQPVAHTRSANATDTEDESDMSLCEFDCSPSSWTMLSSLPSVSIPGTPPSSKSYWNDHVKILSTSNRSTEDWSLYLAPTSKSVTIDKPKYLAESRSSLPCPQLPRFRPQLFTRSPMNLGSVSLRDDRDRLERPVAGRRRAASSSCLPPPVSLPLWPRLLDSELTADGYRHVLERRVLKRTRLD
ncbi:uncharacterized protein SCHCODRAFT_02503360 [Schizophyllum commune H4-8]|nr:uncharacterized protein SCHCODRAFT_02503360 [Schizophyllum commune H4-8]KAI5892862.1 hypothetical protein SCHCODRAFT_02503360 [Schizophyllum commune H4-8]